MTERNKPDLVVRDGSLKATVWNNRGDNGSYHTVAFAKTYEDKEGDLKDTQSFYQSDLLRIAELSRETYGKISDLRRDQNRDQNRAENQAQSQEPPREERDAFREQRSSPAQTRDHPRER